MCKVLCSRKEIYFSAELFGGKSKRYIGEKTWFDSQPAKARCLCDGQALTTTKINFENRPKVRDVSIIQRLKYYLKQVYFYLTIKMQFLDRP